MLGNITNKITNKTSQQSGYIAIFVTMLIWAGFALSVRTIGKSPLTTADVALLRFGIPSLLLLPFLPSRWAKLSSLNPLHILMILVGSGLPFFYAASTGGASTSAAYVGALIPGASPIFVALLAYILYAQKVSMWKIFCLMIIGISIAALLSSDSGDLGSNVLKGSTILLGASCLWAVYTLGLRKVEMDAIGCTILLCIPSFLILVTLVLCDVVPTHIGQFSLDEALPFILVQGLGVGVLASLTYSYAIQTIGADKSAVIGSMTPAVASLLAIPLLGEELDLNTIVGVALLTIAVCCSNLKMPSFRRA